MTQVFTKEIREVKLLLVEDNSDDEFLAKVALNRVGIEAVTVAYDGERALEMLFGENRLSPDLVILDLRLPKIDGLQVLQKIREDSSTRNIPVIIVTSSDDPGDKDFCRNLGILAIVCKPLKESDIRAALNLKWPVLS